MFKYIIVLLSLLYLPILNAMDDEQASQPSPYDSDNRGVSKDDATDGLPDEQETNLYSG